ncbi:MAG: hypothetical protein JW942_03615 [Opitutales bacterium]|nr:hypothetical protein [Opitutales bacterium]
MYQNQEVLQGWDAVMNLLESSVNAFFLDQWNRYTGASGQMPIYSIWCEGVLPFQDIWFTNVYQFDIILGPPLFQFTSGQNTVTVRQNIISGVFKVGTMEVPQDFNPSNPGPIDPQKVTWTSTTTIDSSANAYISGTVELTQVTNIVAGANTLILDFAKGAFTLNNLTVEGVKDASIVDQLKNWFATNEIRYVIASINFRNITGQPALTPTSFVFNVITTNAGNTIVQLLITTNGSAPSSRTINVNEPIPTADNLTCSLMVSSRILYNDVLIAGFNNNGGSFSLVPVYPQTPSQIWLASICPQFHFSGSFSFGSCCSRTTVTYSIYLGGIYSGSPYTGFHLSQHVTTTGNAPVTIDVSADYPVALSGSGMNQVLTITPGTPSVVVTGSVENEIKSGLEQILNNDLKNSMAGISFTPVTCFALETMLFPQNLIKMSQAQAPGDLLIVGTFQPYA